MASLSIFGKNQWCGTKPLANLYPGPHVDDDTKVKQIIDNGTWDLTSITHIISDHTMNDILNTHLSSYSQSGDCHHWAHSSDGLFLPLLPMSSSTMMIMISLVGAGYGSSNFLKRSKVLFASFFMETFPLTSSDLAQRSFLITYVQDVMLPMKTYPTYSESVRKQSRFGFSCLIAIGEGLR